MLTVSNAYCKEQEKQAGGVNLHFFVAVTVYLQFCVLIDHSRRSMSWMY